MPQLTSVQISLRQMPNRRRLGRKLLLPQLLLRVDHRSEKRSTVFVVPDRVGVSYTPTKSGRVLLLFRLMEKTQYMYLKPYINLLSLTVLGFVFRFKMLLRVRGLGYKVYVKGSGGEIVFKLGFSHLVKHRFKFGIFAKSLGVKDRMFSIEGDSWLMLTTMAARLQKLKKIDVYRGKGIFKKFFSYKIRAGRKKKK